jgi:tetratricopeptide (TPR) repeat protein
MLAFERGDTVASLTRFLETADRFAGKEYAEQARYQVATLYRRGINVDSAAYHLGILVTRTDRPHLVANALYDLGGIYKAARRYDDAINVLERLRNDYAGYEDAYSKGLLDLGECYEKVKRLDEAIQVYGVVRDLRPDDFGKTAVSRLQRLRKVRR